MPKGTGLIATLAVSTAMHTMLLPALALSVLVSTVPPSAPPALDDPTIVAIFDAANTYDIETGRLALEKSRNKGVRDLAQQFVNDHLAVRQQGRDLAAKLRVTPTPPKQFDLATVHAKAMQALRAKSGAEFDKAYVAHEIAFHQAVLDAVKETLLPAITNAELKEFVQKVGPAFHGHHEAARQLQKKLIA